MRRLIASAAMLAILSTCPVANAANIYANGMPDSNQNYVPQDKVAYAAGYLSEEGCGGAFRLPDGIDTLNDWMDSIGDFSSGLYDGSIRSDDAEFCEIQKDILRAAGTCLHARYPSTIQDAGYGQWGSRRPECTLNY